MTCTSEKLNLPNKIRTELLKDFLLRQMRMSHIFQPVLISRLLKDGGTTDIGEIAMDIFKLDESQVEYY